MHYNLIAPYLEKIFARYQTGFQKGFNPQACLVVKTEKFTKTSEQMCEYTALLTDLSKAFSCLPDDLIIAKLHAYGFDMLSLRLTHSYLTDRYHKDKVSNSNSLWSTSSFNLVQYSTSRFIFRPYSC